MEQGAEGLFVGVGRDGKRGRAVNGPAAPVKLLADQQGRIAADAVAVMVQNGQGARFRAKPIGAAKAGDGGKHVVTAVNVYRVAGKKNFGGADAGCGGQNAMDITAAKSQ